MQPEEVISGQNIAKLREIKAIYDKIELSEVAYVDKFRNLVFLDESDNREIKIKNEIFRTVSYWTSVSAIIEKSKNVKKLHRNLERSGLSLEEFFMNLSRLHSEIKEFLLDRQNEVRGVINEFFSEDYIKKYFTFCEDTSNLDDLYVCVFNLRESFTNTIKEFSSETEKISVDLDLAINKESSPGSILSNINRIMSSFNRYQIVEIVKTMGKFFEIFKKYGIFEDSKNIIADTKQLANVINAIGTDYRKLDQAFDDFKKFYDSWIKVKSNISEFIKLSQKFQAKLNTEESLEFGGLLSALNRTEVAIRNVNVIHSILNRMYSSVENLKKISIS